MAVHWHRSLYVFLMTALTFVSSANAQQSCGALVDTMGTFSVTSTFSYLGAGGLTVARHQSIGPRLILDQPNVITEIGALADSSLPLVVQIRPSLNGVPNPSVVLASFTMSNDNTPGIFTYESVKPGLFLPAGTYFVLFVTQSNDLGTLLATHPPFRAESFPAGSLNLDTEESRYSDGEIAAVRILGCIFDICIQDESSGSIFKFNSTTGDYEFSNCSGLTLSGLGGVTKRGSLITLQDYSANRRVLSRIDTSLNKGNASIQVFAQGRTFTITDRNTANNNCGCVR